MINKIKRLFNWILNLKIMKPIKIAYRIFNSKMEKSIRFELVVVFGICFLIAFFSYGILNKKLSRNVSYQTIKYNYRYDEDYYKRIVSDLKKDNINVENKEKVDNFIDDYNMSNASLIICNIDGKIYYKTKDIVYESINLESIFTNSIDSVSSEKEKTYIYPTKTNNENLFIIFQIKAEISQSPISYEETNPFLALVGSVIIFVFVFMRITNNKMKYIEEISKGLKVIASGNLSYRINEKGKDELRNLALNINYMADEVNSKIEKERLVEKTKNELITNVSHDLRTPLTSIMGYLGLVKEEKYNSEEQKREYLNIAFSKAERLKILIEDLFEFTKLTNEEIKLNLTEVNIVEFISQLTDEMLPLFEEKELKVIQSYPQEKAMVLLDSDKMLRVFENLLTNAIKYSYKDSEVKISLWMVNKEVFISVKNRGDHMDRNKLKNVFDRFYRTDESRNSNTGGSGLGLAIAKNIVTMHGGKIWAESLGNNITFVVKLNVK